MPPPGAPDMTPDAVGSSNGDVPDDEFLDVLGPSWSNMSQRERDQYVPRGDIGESDSAHGVEGPYFVTPSGLFHRKRTKDGVVLVQLTNFAARITADIVRDDGVETSRAFEVETTRGAQTERFTVPASAFNALGWVPERVGAAGIVYPGVSIRDHARAAIQELSGEPPRHCVYAHTGWRQIGGDHGYLHAGGAIGPAGSLPDVSVDLDGMLRGYVLPEPPTSQALIIAVRASLRLLAVAPDRITAVLLGVTYRAPLGAVDLSCHLAGPTGTFKTALAALVQQHYGQALDARHLPASWSSTANALEAQAFTTKDAVMVVDDFAPHGSTAEQHQLHGKADRLLRAQGNASGRGRLRSDATQQLPRPPRGLVLSTGEDVPTGQSLRARVGIVQVSPGDVRTERLTACQHDADSGLLAGALAGYVQWMAPNIEALQAGLSSEIAELRAQFTGTHHHRRTSGIVADLAVGCRTFLTFATTVGAINETQHADLWQRMLCALIRFGESQAEHQIASEPTQRFLELLGAAVVSGAAHVAALSGGRPDQAGGWGWTPTSNGGEESEWHARGGRVGWTDGDDLYLEPTAAYAAAQRMARDGGDAIPVSEKTLRKRLRENGLLRTTDVRGGQNHLAVRRQIDGQVRNVLHLDATAITALRSGQSGHTGQSCPDPRLSATGTDSAQNPITSVATNNTNESSDFTEAWPLRPLTQSTRLCVRCGKDDLSESDTMCVRCRAAAAVR